ncbi:50S ribosomal protein L11 methyltransferase [Helicobacter jaachi]|uniref:Ribosomal protein L11 methyltransferase n=1 Tax=Helicobacter jaachi TaxID=1677920 RepID=A0A4U8TAQ3_9HELI|nr:50S ribosomal protein L11 methyltransferase [Helicobacter jaachi]TLD96941.1 50S ribosomal protein L11 methyltransferase [Helicobacter jaachi]
MQGLDKQVYYEIIIHPSGFVEQFADFILQETSCAVEFIDSISAQNPFAITYDDASWQGFNFHIAQAKLSAQPTQIIARLEHINLQAFIESMQAFAATLAQNTQMQVGFCYHIAEKLNKDWIKAYEDSVQPVYCAGFYIRPSWHNLPNNIESSKDIIINPALAFGSGHHASTAMCLELLQEANICGKTLLDVGCGSGILSIAAAKLGAQVYACDTDALCIKESQKNALLNHTTFASLWQGSINNAPSEPKHYDVIVANIIAFVVKLLHNDFKAKLAKNGLLILSGILSEYKFDIIEAFSDFNLLETRTQGEWIALKLTL